MFEAGAEALSEMGAGTVPCGFVAGFAARHAAPADRIARAFTAPPAGFAAAAPGAPPQPRPYEPRPSESRSTGPRAAGPKHFSPADRDANPTAGWDLLDPSVPADPPGLDPLGAAHAAGYAEGYAAAAAAAAAEAEARARDGLLLDRLGDALASGVGVDRAMLAGRLRATVLSLVARLVGEAGVSADRLAGRVEAAAAMLADAGESALLRVHPDDVALLDGRLPPNLFAAGDPHVARGAFVLESQSTVVEDGPAAWLEQLEQALDRVALPPMPDAPC